MSGVLQPPGSRAISLFGQAESDLEFLSKQQTTLWNGGREGGRQLATDSLSASWKSGCPWEQEDFRAHGLHGVGVRSENLQKECLLSVYHCRCRRLVCRSRRGLPRESEQVRLHAAVVDRQLHAGYDVGSGLSCQEAYGKVITTLKLQSGRGTKFWLRGWSCLYQMSSHSQYRIPARARNSRKRSSSFSILAALSSEKA